MYAVWTQSEDLSVFQAFTRSGLRCGGATPVPHTRPLQKEIKKYRYHTGVNVEHWTDFEQLCGAAQASSRAARISRVVSDVVRAHVVAGGRHGEI